MKRVKKSSELVIYTDDNDINDKIEASAVVIQYNEKLESFLDTIECHIVYIGELRKINLILNYA